MLWKWWKKYNVWIIIGIILLLSPLIKVLGESWVYLLVSLVLWIFFVKSKSRFSWLVLIVLVLLNLNLNRLFNIDVNFLHFSFDNEQSFLAYPGINESIARYKYEGLWIPYFLRGIFYGKYLVIFSWMINLSKLVSLLFWVKLIGFSGSFLMFQGLVEYTKSRKRNYKIMVWFILVLLTSSLRVLGDTNKFVLLGLPQIVYWMYIGFKKPIIKYNQSWLCLLLLLDFILK